MTYLNFLLIFLGLPLAGLALLHWRDRGRRALPPGLLGLPAVVAVLVHIAVALAYTTPWDNYLVATGVWYYDPALVLGITFGWVPLEEYLFFMLQPLLAGGWLLWLARRVPGAQRGESARLGLRLAVTAVAGLLWLAAAGVLLSAWRPGTYLGLALAWALPPIMLQLAVVADLLWRQRRLVATAILSTTVYLCAADALAIGAGTWTISPAHSLNVFVAGLPLEEIVFFLATNILIVFGITLSLTPETRARLGWLARLWLRLTERDHGRQSGPARPRGTRLVQDER
jgi:lycopene cyclase domain-containing protein